MSSGILQSCAGECMKDNVIVYYDKCQVSILRSGGKQWFLEYIMIFKSDREGQIDRSIEVNIQK